MSEKMNCATCRKSADGQMRQLLCRKSAMEKPVSYEELCVEWEGQKEKGRCGMIKSQEDRLLERIDWLEKKIEELIAWKKMVLALMSEPPAPAKLPEPPPVAPAAPVAEAAGSPGPSPEAKAPAAT